MDKYYYVDKNVQKNGEHQVHTSSCVFLPDSPNIIGVGSFSSSSEAVEEAKEFFSVAASCSYCCK